MRSSVKGKRKGEESQTTGVKVGSEEELLAAEIECLC